MENYQGVIVTHCSDGPVHRGTVHVEGEDLQYSSVTSFGYCFYTPAQREEFVKNVLEQRLPDGRPVLQQIWLEKTTDKKGIGDVCNRLVMRCLEGHPDEQSL